MSKIIKEINDNGNQFIKSYDDIVDGNLINNLLNQEQYRDVRNSNIKLWFNSFEILKDVIHSEEINYTENEKNELDKNSRIYVKNDSFNEAIQILEKNNFVIISGIPGIGKTSLARILSSYYLQIKNFKQFYAISNHIKNGFKFFRKGEKQIFFYDDFLGKNFLETLLSKNEDESIIKFIKAIQSDASNKICIFTTREYILKQAQYKYERLNNPLLDAQKCTIDLKKYTKKSKHKYCSIICSFQK